MKRCLAPVRGDDEHVGRSIRGLEIGNVGGSILRHDRDDHPDRACLDVVNQRGRPREQARHDESVEHRQWARDPAQLPRRRDGRTKDSGRAQLEPALEFARLLALEQVGDRRRSRIAPHGMRNTCDHLAEGLLLAGQGHIPSSFVFDLDSFRESSAPDASRDTPPCPRGPRHPRRGTRRAR